MLKSRMKRLATETQRALDRLTAIEGAVAGLGDEDLLDLADIFAPGNPTPLSAMAETEMQRRGLTL